MDKLSNEPLQGQTNIFDFPELFGIGNTEKKQPSKRKERPTVPVPIRTEDWIKEHSR